MKRNRREEKRKGFERKLVRPLSKSTLMKINNDHVNQDGSFYSHYISLFYSSMNRAKLTHRLKQRMMTC